MWCLDDRNTHLNNDSFFVSSIILSLFWFRTEESTRFRSIVRPFLYLKWVLLHPLLFFKSDHAFFNCFSHFKTFSFLFLSFLCLCETFSIFTWLFSCCLKPFSFIFLLFCGYCCFFLLIKLYIFPANNIGWIEHANWYFFCFYLFYDLDHF